MLPPMVMRVQSGLSFLRPYFADHFGMADLLFLVDRDIVVIDDEERVGSGHLFGAWLGALPNALAETA